MGRSKRFGLVVLSVLAGTVSACGPTARQDQASTPAAVQATAVAEAPSAATATSTALPSPATATSTAPAPSPTVEPSPTATTLPTATPVPPPTNTPAPPTPTADPWAAYAPFTIEGLRSRGYGEGQIETVRVLEETAAFTRLLFAYRGDGLRLTGMMNRPRGAGPFPVVILNHGYYPIDVYQTGNGTKLAADYLASRGFLTLSPDFRSHAGSDDAPNLFRAGHVIDVLNLIPLAQQMPDARPGKVGMWGHSNGGAITAKAIVVSDQIAAAVIYAPASSNIVEDYGFRVERARARGAEIDPIEWPVKPEEGPDLYERLSPLPYLQYVQAPVQIHYGTADQTVPLKWPDDLRKGLEAAGKDVTMYVYEGQPHSFQGAPNGLYLQRMAEFFEQRVRDS